MALVSVPIALLALAGGTFLLIKTKKDNLGIIFKIISYFIIVVALLNMACACMVGMWKFYGKGHMYGDMKMERQMMKHGMGGMGGMGMGGMGMGMHHGGMGMGNMPMHGGMMNMGMCCPMMQMGCGHGCGREEKCMGRGNRCCETEKSCKESCGESKDTCGEECSKEKK